MINTDSNVKLSNLLSSIKLLLLVASAFMLIQEVFKDATNLEIILKEPKDFFISIAFFVVLFSIWFFIGYRFSKKEAVLKKVQNIILFILMSGIIIACAAMGRDHKHLFFLVVIIMTIENGLSWGIISPLLFFVLYMLALFRFGQASGVAMEGNVLFGLELLLTSYIIGYYISEKEQYIKVLKNLAEKDGLTGVYNHRYLISYLEEKILEYREKNTPLALLLIDIDDFKIYNEYHGHVKGDEILSTFAKLFEKNAKGGIVCRQGGDEFAIVGRFTENQAMSIANKICEEVSDTKFYGEEYLQQKKLTVSIGVAKMSEDAKSVDDLVHFADIALYRAKFMDKNQVRKYENIFESINDSDKFKNEMLTAIRTLITVINTRDEFTYNHIENVVNYMKGFANWAEYDDYTKKVLVYASYMHDIGKINIPSRVLMKATKLDEEEIQMLRKHPEWGANIISELGYDPELIPIVKQHHERYDGTGYPDGLKGEQISKHARLLTLIDSFDAMTNLRPYKRKMSFTEAVEEIKRCKGTQFDPELTDMFLEFLLLTDYAKKELAEVQ
ncbi:MAG TPA: hypothetical protein DDZ89_20895 [Clostridiales bacterium]|nr:hypothetical protein [Clostridiales bacterium]